MHCPIKDECTADTGVFFHLSTNESVFVCGNFPLQNPLVLHYWNYTPLYPYRFFRKPDGMILFVKQTNSADTLVITTKTPTHGPTHAPTPQHPPPFPESPK